MIYNKKILDRYKSTQNIGSFDKNDPNVGTAIVGSPSCGDVMKLQIKVGKDKMVEDAVFKTFGCGPAIASSSLIAEIVKGKYLHEISEIKNEDIAKHLELPKIKIHCSILAEDAIRFAVKDYYKKQNKQQDKKISILKLTNAAKYRMIDLLDKKKSAVGMRVSIEKSGCFGLMYSVKYAYKEDRNDEIQEFDQIKLFIDKKALMFVIGTEIDFIEDEMQSKFVFKNPNEKMQCKCGKSFSIKESLSEKAYEKESLSSKESLSEKESLNIKECRTKESLDIKE